MNVEYLEDKIDVYISNLIKNRDRRIRANDNKKKSTKK